jgi:hypothetical protein
MQVVSSKPNRQTENAGMNPSIQMDFLKAQLAPTKRLSLVRNSDV